MKIVQTQRPLSGYGINDFLILLCELLVKERGMDGGRQFMQAEILYVAVVIFKFLVKAANVVKLHCNSNVMQDKNCIML